MKILIFAMAVCAAIAGCTTPSVQTDRDEQISDEALEVYERDEMLQGQDVYHAPDGVRKQIVNEEEDP